MKKELLKMDSYLVNLWAGSIELDNTFFVSLKALVEAGIGDLNEDFREGFLNWPEIAPIKQNIFIDRVISEMPGSLLTQGLSLGAQVNFELPFQAFYALLKRGQLSREVATVGFARDREGSLRLVSFKWIRDYEFWKVVCLPFGHSPLPVEVWYIHG